MALRDSHMIDRFQVVPAAYVVLRRQAGLGAQVLLQVRRGTGYMDEHWACAAAGHVESGESVLDTACREALEELGITIDPTDLRPLCAMHRTAEAGWRGQRVDFFFECSRWSGAPRLLEADKAAELRWFDLDALPAPVVPHELFVLGTLADGGPAPIVTFGF